MDKMNLGGQGPSELGKTTKKISMEEVRNVGPEPAAMVPNKREAIEDVGGSSPLKMCCKKH